MAMWLFLRLLVVAKYYPLKGMPIAVTILTTSAMPLDGAHAAISAAHPISWMVDGTMEIQPIQYSMPVAATTGLPSLMP